jgi:nitrous oxidase accessory protein
MTRSSIDSGSRRPHGRPSVLALVLVAAALVLAARWLPLWQMKLEAPQYPDGLRLVAYGDRIEGDLDEINIINHYIGMAEIEETPVVEMRLFPWGLGALSLLLVLSLWSRFLLRIAPFAVLAMPIAILADLQLWLHRYGTDLDPSAPLRFVEPFTPLAIGVSSIGNFRSFSIVSWGFGALLAAAVLAFVALRLTRLGIRAAAASGVAVRASAASLLPLCTLALALAIPVSVASPAEAASDRIAARRPVAELQALIDAAGPGGRVEVRGGSYAGTLRLRGPIEVEGVAGEDGARPEIDAGGSGSAVVVEGDGVVLRGFAVRGSSRSISEEAAGIRATGSRHLFEANRVEDVYFGIHLSDGEDNVVRGNVVRPAIRPGERPGHALSLWYQRRARVEDNVVEHARDGVYLSFSDDARITGNRVTASRYGVHSMYSLRSVFEGNELDGNLLGAALMSSEGLVLRCNRIVGHREGATAYAVLLKDVADVLVEGNVIADNRVGVYADNTPSSAAGEAVVRGNRIAGNEAALALQSTARLTFYDNTMLDNLAMVRLEGRGVAAGSAWSRDGRGNHWDDYHGFDRDRDGVGDVAYRSVLALPELLRGDAPSRALLWTPAHQVVETAARLFPVVRPVPVIDDPAPLMRPPQGQCGEVAR